MFFGRRRQSPHSVLCASVAGLLCAALPAYADDRFDVPSPSNYGGANPDDPVPNGDSGLIVGHFIRFVDSVGGDGSVACDPNSINACVIVMTR